MGGYDALRDQFDKQTKRLAQERRDGIARTMDSDKSFAALREATNRSRERLQKVNVDLRDANVAQRTELQDLKGLVGLRNGDLHDLRREVRAAADEIVDLISSNENLRNTGLKMRERNRDLAGAIRLDGKTISRLVGESLSQVTLNVELRDANVQLRKEISGLNVLLSARNEQFDGQRNRLSNVGIMLDDLREQMSKERAQVAINRVSSEKSHGEDMYRAGIRYNALKFDLREIGRLSSNASEGDVWADLMKINAIAQKG